MSDNITEHKTTHVVHERIETIGGAGLAFVVGGLFVAVLILAWLFTDGDFRGGTDIEVEVPAASAPAVESAPATPAGN